MKKIFYLYLLFSSLLSVAQSRYVKEFTLNHGELVLSGQIEYPDSSRAYPAAILIWGNGPHTRDQEISGSPMFAQMSDFLVSKGLAVLRMDKRGFGKSKAPIDGAESNYTTMDLAEDVQLALDYLKQQQWVDTTQIGLVGHSEGAMIAPILASKPGNVDWMVLMAPPAVSGIEIDLAQAEVNRERLGFDSLTSQKIGAQKQRYLEYLIGPTQSDSVFYQIGKDFLLAHGLEANDPRINNEFIDQILGGYKTDWNRYFLKFDPKEYLMKTNIPTLAIYGANDWQVSFEQNASVLKAALKASGNRNFEINLLGDLGHFFLTHNDQSVEKHVFGEMKVSRKLLDRIANWLKTEGFG